MRKFLAALLCLYLLFAGLTPARAQSQNQNTAHLSLYALQTANFPAISAGLDVFDSAGNVVTGLKPGAITLLEDNKPRPITSLQEVKVGVEFALALDPGPTFAFRDANAVTRYDKIVQILKSWVASHSDSLDDDLSLVPTYGTLSAHMTSTAAFSDALAAYLPNLQSISPSLNTLSSALDTVSESTSTPGMKKTVLYVTSPTAVDAIPTLQNLTERAVGQQVRVNVWIVASTDFFSSSGATALKDLAIQTGGQYLLFSGVEPLPGLETYFAPLRSTYQLTYNSGILTPGGHTLTAQATLDGAAVSSAELSFSLDIQPPNPMLVAPPDQIVRQAPDAHTTATTAFLPSQQPIEIIVEFPDGRTRPLVSTTLFVDNQKVAENTAEPFDHFTWDLSGYATSGQHILSVEAVDSLGLSKISLGVPVMVTVIRPQFGLLPFLSRNSPWVALVAIIFAGALLSVILGGGRFRRRAGLADQAATIDPLTQPVEGETGRHMRVPWKRPARQSDAYLERLKEDGQPTTAPPIPVIAPEMTFGSDPMQVTRILDDPSVSPLHARLLQQDGEYILSDEKSVAGTWVNYELLAAPRPLQHGDVLQFGRLSYRFMLRKPPERPRPKITPTKV
ncbi:MAG: FHA domain-containing protein [Anaerolineales bacterium]